MQNVARPKFRDTRQYVPGPDDIWSMDFAFSRLVRGASLQVLTVVDVNSGYVRVIDPQRRQHVDGVIRALQRVGARRGYPGTIRICPGSELDFHTLQRWAYESRTTLSFSLRRTPSESAAHQALIGQFRVACLNNHQFLTVAEASEKMEAWRINHNALRTFSSMAKKVPISLPFVHAVSSRRSQA